MGPLTKKHRKVRSTVTWKFYGVEFEVEKGEPQLKCVRYMLVTARSTSTFEIESKTRSRCCCLTRPYCLKLEPNVRELRALRRRSGGTCYKVNWGQ